MAHLVTVSDLLVDPGSARDEITSIPLEVALPNAAVDGDARVVARMRSLSDGIVVTGTATVTARLVCNRCLMDWDETIELPFEQVYRLAPDDTDDELPITDGHRIDLEPAVHDEVSLSLPVSPTCRPDCAGLCATCGTDLNEAPCDGHGDEVDSPFASLKQLFDS